MNVTAPTRQRPVQIQGTHRRQQSSVSSCNTLPPSATSTHFFSTSPPQTPSRQTTTSSSSVTTPTSIHSQAIYYDEQGKYHGPVAVPAGSFPSLQKHFTRDCVNGIGSPSKYQYNDSNLRQNISENKGEDESESEDDEDYGLPPTTPVKFQKSPIESPVRKFQRPANNTSSDEQVYEDRRQNRGSVLVNSSISQGSKVIKTEKDQQRFSVYITLDDIEDLTIYDLAVSGSLNPHATDNRNDQLEDDNEEANQSFQSLEHNPMYPLSPPNLRFNNTHEKFHQQRKGHKKNNSITNFWRRVTGGTNDNSDETGKRLLPAGLHKRNKSSAI